MTAERGVVRAIREAVAAGLGGRQRVVLAVSGGMDSMVLLDAAVSEGVRAAGGGLQRLAGFPSAPWPAASENETPLSPTPPLDDQNRPELIVATFDHGTGDFARDAAELVERRAAELGLECASARAERRASSETEWREQRWEFLRSVARDPEAVVATAHNLDDQVETVFIRALRDAGPRGLAGLYAASDVLRPLIRFRRTEIEAYARSERLEYVSDPTNASRAHLRNRVRLDLLPAISSVRPAFRDELLSVARRAAEWRARVGEIVDGLPLARHADGSVYVARGAIERFGAHELRVLWPEIAARAGVTMDRRGTHRVASFTIQGSTGGSIQLSGGGEVVRTREHFVVRRNQA